MSDEAPGTSKPDDGLETVKLSSRDLDDAKRILAALVGNEDAYETVASRSRREPTRRMMVKRAQTTFLNRRRRGQIFGSNLFGEPAWDMLLALYITEDSGPRNTVGRLVAFSGASMTTALRWLDVLERNNFIERAQHPTDQRSSLISLSEVARTALDAYFSETLTNGM